MLRHSALSHGLVGLVAVALGVACTQPAPSAAPAAAPAAVAPQAPSSQAADPASAIPPAPAAYQGPLRKLRLGYGFVSTDVTPMWIAIDQGIFAKHGFDVDTTLMQTSAQLAPAMAAGELDIALSAGAGVVDLNLAGGDQVIVTTQTNLLYFQVHARPDIRRVEDLRDKRVGITRLGSGVHLAATEALKRHGLEAGRDVALVQGGAADAVLTALVSGATDAATIGNPHNFLMERQGYPLLVDVREYGVPFSAAALVVTRPVLEARYDFVRDFVRAYVEAAGVAKRDVPLGMRTLGKYLQLDDQDLLDRSYRFWLATLDDRLWPSAAAVQAVLDLRAEEIPAARTANPRDYVDERIMRELEQSGYLQRALGGG